MRQVTKTYTGNIISDEDLKLEYLFVGDYGKQNNIKADFLGFTNRIDYVKHTEVDLTEKLVVTISSQKGCCMNCNFCDCPKYGFYGNATACEMLSEINTAIALSGVKRGKRLNIHFARMGEPTFNNDVIEVASIMSFTSINKMFEEYHPVVSTMMPKTNKNLFNFLSKWVLEGYNHGGEDGYGLQFSINTLDEIERDKMFDGKSLSLSQIGLIIAELPFPKKRKFTLNFAVTSQSNLDVDLMNKYFDKDKCIVKITPMHKTHRVVENGIEVVKDFDVYEKFEQPLVKDGWDVIVFIPSEEEDSDRITCGNSLLSIK